MCKPLLATTMPLTTDGLVMKGVDRIETINTRYEERLNVNLATFQCSRIIRRDFNLLSIKMFFFKSNREKTNQFKRLLREMKEEANFIESIALRCEYPKELPATKVPLRIISEEAKELLESVLIVDRAFAKMLADEAMREVAEENCLRFFAAFGRFKRFVMGFRDEEKSLAEEQFSDNEGVQKEQSLIHQYFSKLFRK